MKLYFSLLLTASWLSAAGAAADDLNNDETSRRLMGDPLNNLRGGWPGPTPSMTTQVPTGFSGPGTTQVPTGFSGPGTTQVPTGFSGPGTTQVPTGFSGPGTPIPTEECGPSIDNYTKMGKGRCLGSNGNQHPLIRYDNVASAEDCPNLCNCALANGLTLRGFDYTYNVANGNGQCRCRVESWAATPTCGIYQNPTPIGSGPVTSTDNDPNFCCFRNDLPPAPSVSPAPSTSLMPSESLPPSQSLSPTEECGPSIDNYTKMGKGKCVDSNGKTHPMIKYFNGVNSAAECEDKCDCLTANFNLQGFDYNVVNGECRCRVDDATLPLGACGGTFGGVSNPNKDGFGPVTSTDNASNFCCFRNDLTSPAPSVSPAPSTSFVPSVSSAPTRLWKNGKPCNSGAMCCSQCCLPPTTAPAGENVCTNSIKDTRCASYPNGGVNFCRTEAPSTA